MSEELFVLVQISLSLKLSITSAGVFMYIVVHTVCDLLCTDCPLTHCIKKRDIWHESKCKSQPKVCLCGCVYTLKIHTWVCMYDKVRLTWIDLWQFNENAVSDRCCLNELKMKVCIFNLCVDVVALKPRCTVWLSFSCDSSSPRLCSSKLNHLLVSVKPKTHSADWVPVCASYMKDKWHCAGSVVVHKVLLLVKIFQGVSITSVFTAHCSPAHIMFWIWCLFFASSRPDLFIQIRSSWIQSAHKQ